MADMYQIFVPYFIQNILRFMLQVGNCIAEPGGTQACVAGLEGGPATRVKKLRKTSQNFLVAARSHKRIVSGIQIATWKW